MNKLEAREVTVKAGLPLIPGTFQSSSSDMGPFAQHHDYPILLKARDEAFTRCKNESILAELAVPHARHIEVQIVGDRHGNCIYWLERDGSIQKRYQKVFEGKSHQIKSNIYVLQ
ncbi:hypothetical protein BY458DRAFT_555406 [Sporodiniella umbellata]|nr:hypothetical protein BY458DRAFT_555406 [Sporodiniella umbellata]